MLINQRVSSGLQNIAFAELMKGVCTSIPGHIVTFNDKLQRAQIQIGLEEVHIDGSTVIPRAIEDVPVIFPGGDYTLEFEVGEGTEGAILFSQRCIDGWKNTGGVATNPLARFHDKQDAFFVPGMRSQPGAITDFQNNGIRIRNKTGSQFAWLKNDGSVFLENGAGYFRLMPDGTVIINGVTFSTAGNVTTAGNMQATVVTGTTNVVFGNRSGIAHTHSGVQPGSGNTGPPNT